MLLCISVVYSLILLSRVPSYRCTMGAKAFPRQSWFIVKLLLGVEWLHPAAGMCCLCHSPLSSKTTLSGPCPYELSLPSFNLHLNMQVHHKGGRRWVRGGWRWHRCWQWFARKDPKVLRALAQGSLQPGSTALKEHMGLRKRKSVSTLQEHSKWKRRRRKFRSKASEKCLLSLKSA